MTKRIRQLSATASIVIAFSLAFSFANAAPSYAATAPSVALWVSPAIVTTGQATTFSGQVRPWATGRRVRLVDPHGRVLASTLTRAHGKFSVKFTPRANTWVAAEYRGARSPHVEVRVQPVLTVSLADVRLFGQASVAGTLRPWLLGKTVHVELFDGSTVVANASVRVGQLGRFAARIPIRRPGTYRARVDFAGADYLPASAVSGALTTPLPSLSIGSSGVYVWLLEQRLVALHYHLDGASDSHYDFRTADAVMALHKVQGMARTGYVDTATWYALASPKTLTPRVTSPADHVEVDQTRQVLFVVRGGSVVAILHVSTGKPSTPTRDGTFTVRLKVPGENSEHMYYSSFFDGNRAIHGYPEVPPYAASHGCVRIPDWAAVWMYGLDPIGTEVLVYH